MLCTAAIDENESERKLEVPERPVCVTVTALLAGPPSVQCDLTSDSRAGATMIEKA